MKPDKVPPHDPQIECSLLAGCFLSNDTARELVESIKPEVFYKTANKQIFESITQLVAGGKVPDTPTVCNHLKGRGLLECVGGGNYLQKILDYPIPMKPQQYAQTLYEKYALREILNACYQAEDLCFSNEDPGRLLDELQSKINGLAVAPTGQTAAAMSDCVIDALDRCEYIHQHKGKLIGLETGLEQLDRITCGFQPSDLIILAARPSMGKTALAIGLPPHPTHWFSLEMSKAQLTNRRLSVESGVNLQHFRDGYFSQDDWQKMNSAAARITDYPIYIDDTGGLDYMEIRRRARKLHKERDTKLIIVDHLQLVRGDRGSTRDREIGSITSGLKNLAKELEIPVLLLCQLNRKLEERGSGKKRPVLSDLRDSGNIEQDADVVVFIYRDEVYNKKPDNPEKGMAELIVAKQRNGPTGFMKAAYIAHMAAFKNLTSADNMAVSR